MSEHNGRDERQDKRLDNRKPDWKQPPDDPEETRDCGACPGTLAWDESAEEWYHVESLAELEKQMARESA